jgi:6-phosphogluconolactonase/glucosamine-6-phosphate isomerase/deaminase
MNLPDIIRTSAFAKDAANFILDKADSAISQNGNFILGLCGGKTPIPIYAELVKKATDSFFKNTFLLLEMKDVFLLITKTAITAWQNMPCSSLQ